MLIFELVIGLLFVGALFALSEAWPSSWSCSPSPP
jgi:hypothetical protein